VSGLLQAGADDAADGVEAQWRERGGRRRPGRADRDTASGLLLKFGSTDCTSEQQVRAPLQQAPKSPRTPHDASSEGCRPERVPGKPRSEPVSRLIALLADAQSVK
jgi:hypothetical protein